MKKLILSFFVVLNVFKISGQAVCLNSAPYSPVQIPTLGYQFCFADFNLDGKIDFAAIGYASIQFEISLSNGNGFSPANTYTVIGNPTSIATGDFNNDGKPDLVMTVSYSGVVMMFIGNGDGTFAGASNFLAGSEPSFLIVGDFNSDGNKDLAVSNFVSNNISILIGDGNGSFPTQNTYTINTKPNYILKGDFNNDTQEDLAVGNDSIVFFLQGNGNGTFNNVTNSSVTLLGQFKKLYVDTDNKIDLVGINQNSLCVFKNNGNFNFSQTFQQTTGLVFIADGEFNNDGLRDIALVNQMSAVTTVSVLLNNGLGGFVQSATNTLANGFLKPFSIYCTDINNDQRDDIVIGLDNSSDVHILLNCKVVGIDKFSNQNEEVKVFPVPADYVLKITIVSSDNLSVNQLLEDYNTWKIYNHLWQQVKSGEALFKDRTQTINISELPVGVYHLQLKGSKSKILAKQFIISR